MNRRRLPLLLTGGLLSAGALMAAILCGSAGCSVSAEFTSLIALRAPRAVTGFTVGALLALAGALMQLLLRNPLADPYVLGVSGGSATGAMLAALLFPAIAVPVAMQFGALGGALLSVLLMFMLAWRKLSGLSSRDTLPGASLILTGVMISAGFGALITLLMSLSSDSTLRGTLFWLMGDLDAEAYPVWAMAALFVSASWASLNAGALNVLAHGEVTAQLLGLNVRRMRMMALLIASLATSAAVAAAGAIGFIGLVVPHLLRLRLGNDQRLLLPASVLLGGSALVLADLAARTVVAPVQLPVGVVTALIGVPVFLYLLRRSRA